VTGTPNERLRKVRKIRDDIRSAVEEWCKGIRTNKSSDSQFLMGEEDMAIKKPIRTQDENSDSLEGTNGFALLKEKEVEAIRNFQFKEEAYLEAVVDMKEWI
jgi:uncharacterized coiled-coil DUF342 family protein